MADEIDQPHEVIADELGISLDKAKRVHEMIKQAEVTDHSLILGKVIGMLLASSNQPAMIYAFAFASGLDQLNGIGSQTEVAKNLGFTRSLMSHYVCAARDILSGKDSGFDCVKYRKSNASRKTFADKAKSQLLEHKRKARAKYEERITTKAS